MNNPYQQMIAQAASAYGVDAGVLDSITKRESGYRPSVINHWDSNAKAGIPSGGLDQFIQPTFNAYSRQARAADPGAWKGVNGKWLDPMSQLLTTAWAIKNGHGSAWSTYSAALKDAGKFHPGPATISGPSMTATPAAAVSTDDPTADAILAKDTSISPIVLSLLSQDGASAAAAPASHGATTGAAAPSLPGLPKGISTFGGKQIAAWIAPALEYAKQHGWGGGITSGYRSLADQTRIYNSGVRPAAAPGTSNHEFTAFPGGAVDVSDPQQLSSILASSPYAKLLVWAGAKDPVHFSHPHNGSY